MRSESSNAHFVGNSMGAVNMFVDATSESPVLPAASLVMICGGGEIQRNEHSAALYDYDATLAGMRRIVEALFSDPSYPADDAYVTRRYESSIAPGAWEALAAARFRRPGPGAAAAAVEHAGRTSASPCRRWSSRGRATSCCRRLGGGDRGQIAGRPFGCRSREAGHCPQIEQPGASTHCCWTSSARCDERTAAHESTNWTGKVAIVTGGASGLGEGLVRRFAAEGAKVLIGDIDRDAGAALAADIGADALFVEADVSDIDQVGGLVIDGGRAVRRTARHGQQRRECRAPCTAASSTTTSPTSTRSWRSICLGGDGRNPRCRAAHGRGTAADRSSTSPRSAGSRPAAA